MLELPVEIWSHITSFAAHKDLLLMCLVSTLHLHVSRRALAQDIVLDGKKPRNHSENMQSLVDKGLARNVRTLTVRNFDDWMDDDPLACVRSMVNLRALWIRDCKALFINAAEQRSLIKGLPLTRLSSVRISALSGTFRGAQFAIAGLNDLEWKQNRGKFHPTFFSLCKASCATITSLSIIIRSVPSKPSVYGDIFDLRFPRLVSLKIGPGHEGFHDERHESRADETATAFVKFLMAHVSVEELVLYWDYESTNSPGDMSLPVQLEPMKTSSFLPNLLTIDALPYEGITKFLSAGVSFLQTLTSLHLYQKPVHDRTFIYLMQSFTAYNAQHGPTSICHLRVSIEDARTMDSSTFNTLMEAAAEAFPDLESWASSTPADTTALVAAFSRFPKLKELLCAVGHRTIDTSLARILVENCPALRCLKCLNSGRLYQVVREAGKTYRLQTGAFNITESDLLIRDDTFRWSAP